MSEKKDRVTIFGVGRLGICFALILEKCGYDVLGVDVFPEYVDALNRKVATYGEPRVAEMLKASKNFRATTSFKEGVEFSDVYWLIVATPSSGGNRAYDHSTVNTLLHKFNQLKLKNKHVIIGCTIIPGYIAHVARHLLRDCENVTVSYNPEFIAQGQIVKDLFAPDMVLIGEGSKEAGDWLEAAYMRMTEKKPFVHRMSPESAEITKLALNCFCTMKITYANQIGDIADRTPGANKFDILRAVGDDSRVGRKLLNPGYGFGGPCFPRDNRALGGYAKTLGLDSKLMFATDEYNAYHSKLMADDLFAKNLDKYVFEDVAYKTRCPVPIIEESQVLVVAQMLAQRGKKVLIRDRKMILDEVRKDFGDIFEYEETE